MIEILFSATLFLSAALVFWVQLIIAKTLLPILGGSSAVWNTCLAFFQTALLAGYFYAHHSARHFKGKMLFIVQPILLALAGSILFLSLNNLSPPDADSSAILWVLKTLVVLVGAPFLVLSATAPLLQNWFSKLGLPSSRDPYFLYAVSNCGSLLALASYPTFIEAHVQLDSQWLIWKIGYGVLGILTALGAIVSYNYVQKRNDIQTQCVSPLRSENLNWATKLSWVVLSFVPSSLLLGVTSYITTDIASIPLFWMIPLFLYLLSYIIAFQKLVPVPKKIISFLQAYFLIPLGFVFFVSEGVRIDLLFALHLAVFFITAIFCHSQLAERRPDSKNLTNFYLYLSLGGALGGLFNALVAPLIFNDVFEYPLMLAIACWLRPNISYKKDQKFVRSNFLWTFIVVLVVWAGWKISPLFLADFLKQAYPNYAEFVSAIVGQINLGIPLVWIFIIAPILMALWKKPAPFAAGILCLFIVGLLSQNNSQIIFRMRNFYGVLKVTDSSGMHSLFNGTTLHGVQKFHPDSSLDLTMYYGPQEPIGQIFSLIGGTDYTKNVALIGLGAGELSCYAHIGEKWTYYELNPADVGIAENPELFTFLKDCPAHPTIVVGDARLSFARIENHSLDTIIIDAFSSDSIPLHLITQEALQLYEDKLRAGGLIIAHISNRHIDLAPVVSSISHSLGLNAYVQIVGSKWVIIEQSKNPFSQVKKDPRWQLLTRDDKKFLWTDNYSDLLAAVIRNNSLE